MDKQVDPAGFAAFFLMIRLIQRLVRLNVLSLEDTRELVDAALLDAEELFANASQGRQVREFLELFLKDIDQSGNS